jgi:2-haloacid dehalogenase
MAGIFVFDAYGTLFDVHSAVARHAGRLGDRALAVSEAWRQKQLEYTWTRSLMGRHRDFWQLTQDGLDFALAKHGVDDAGLRADLLAAYEELAAYPEVERVLTELRRRDGQIAILSNATPQMLARATVAAGIDGLIDALISIEQAGVYKTDPRAYRLVPDRFGCDIGEVRFHSSNRWDAAGAAVFGFDVTWVNRGGAPDEYADAGAVREVKDLEALL